ncbi:MAG TPA: hypothetical protein VHZ73_12610 [Vicinamibacterales bacterium]|nr:hypothetical protein [Vicinamibacterales bacterium]
MANARVAAALALTLFAGRASAQSQERFSLDSVVESDVFRGQNALDRPNFVIDITGVVRVTRGWTLYVRPWFSQRRTTTWDKEIYQAALQYEHSGTVSTRVNIGYIVSPIGLGMMDTRPSVNPMIFPHLSYVTPMAPLEAGGPVVWPVAATYPLGAEFTLSGARWDARAALVDTAPARIYIVNNTSANPAATPVLEAGAGVTPKIGLRIGASFARGDYATGDELKPVQADGRMMTLASVEGEYAFGHTRLSGEMTHDTFATGHGDVVAYEWFVEGMQTLAPRWFVAGRQEGTSAPPPFSTPTAGRQFFHTTETTVGYRLSPEFTFRASFYARKTFTRADWDQQGGVSIVWGHRWW